MATQQFINDPTLSSAVTAHAIVTSANVPPLRSRDYARLPDKPQPRYDHKPPKPSDSGKQPATRRPAVQRIPVVEPEAQAFTQNLLNDSTRSQHRAPTPARPLWAAGRGQAGHSFFEQFTRDAIAATPAPSETKDVMLDPGYLATISKESGTSRTISSGDAAILAKLPFREAGLRWIDARSQGLRGRSEFGLRHHLKQLNKFFGALRVEEIHIGHLHAYQQARIANKVVFTDGEPLSPWKKPSGPSLINHELSVVQQVLKMAQLWTPLAHLYKPLQQPKSTKPKVMSDAEELHFFAVAASRPEWEIASLVTTITRHTTASGCELRNLRLSDVILNEGTPRIAVNGDTAKNNFRGRVIVLNEKALPAVERCLEIAATKGSHRPHHYLFPIKTYRGKWNPEKPCTASWLSRAWTELREATGLPWLTPHCFRHMCITGLLAKGVAPEIVRHIAGHVSEEMMRHYSHNRHEDQKLALDTLAPARNIPAIGARAKPAQVSVPSRSPMLRGRRYTTLRPRRHV